MNVSGTTHEYPLAFDDVSLKSPGFHNVDGVKGAINTVQQIFSTHFRHF